MACGGCIAINITDTSAVSGTEVLISASQPWAIDGGCSSAGEGQPCEPSANPTVNGICSLQVVSGNTKVYTIFESTESNDLDTYNSIAVIPATSGSLPFQRSLLVLECNKNEYAGLLALEGDYGEGAAPPAQSTWGNKLYGWIAIRAIATDCGPIG